MTARVVRRGLRLPAQLYREPDRFAREVNALAGGQGRLTVIGAVHLARTDRALHRALLELAGAAAVATLWTVLVCAGLELAGLPIDWARAAGGILIGALAVMVVGATVDVPVGIAVGIGVAVAGGVAGGVATGLSGGIAGGATGELAAGLPIGLALGVALGLAYRVDADLAAEVPVAVAALVLGGVTGGLVSAVAGVPVGAALAVAVPSAAAVVALGRRGPRPEILAAGRPQPSVLPVPAGQTAVTTPELRPVEPVTTVRPVTPVEGLGPTKSVRPRGKATVRPSSEQLVLEFGEQAETGHQLSPGVTG